MPRMAITVYSDPGVSAGLTPGAFVNFSYEKDGEFRPKLSQDEGEWAANILRYVASIFQTRYKPPDPHEDSRVMAVRDAMALAKVARLAVPAAEARVRDALLGLVKQRGREGAASVLGLKLNQMPKLSVEDMAPAQQPVGQALS